MNKQNHFRELSFFTGRGGHLFVGGGTRIFGGGQRGDHFFFSEPKGGGPKFFEGQRGGEPKGVTRIFLRLPRGGPEFFYVCQGGDQKKLPTGHHKQTAPPSQ